MPLLVGASLFGVVLSGLTGCKADEEIVWVQYNSEVDEVEIQVGSAEVLDPIQAPLTSNTGSLEIGIATVTPGGGPIGTVHDVRVEISADYAPDVDRVSVRTDSGDRGTDEYDLIQDSAGDGFWLIQIQSVGEEGEQRTDTLRLRLWQEG